MDISTLGCGHRLFYKRRLIRSNHRAVSIELSGSNLGDSSKDHMPLGTLSVDTILNRDRQTISLVCFLCTVIIKQRCSGTVTIWLSRRRYNTGHRHSLPCLPNEERRRRPGLHQSAPVVQPSGECCSTPAVAATVSTHRAHPLFRIQRIFGSS